MLTLLSGGFRLIKPIKAISLTLYNLEYYTVSYWGGIIRNTKTGKILTGTYNKEGYIRTEIGGRKNRNTQYVHRLVALAWVKNPKNKPEVNHINRERDDCNVPNLEWSTKKENLGYRDFVNRKYRNR